MKSMGIFGLMVALTLALSIGGLVTPDVGAVGFQEDPNPGGGSGGCPSGCNYCCQDNCGCSDAPSGSYLSYSCSCSVITCLQSCNYYPIP